MIIISSGFVYFGTWGYLNGGYPTRNINELFESPFAKESLILNNQPSLNQLGNKISIGNYNLQYFGDAQGYRTIAVYGDSHASVFVNNFDRIFKIKKIRGVIINSPNTCEVIPYFVINEVSNTQMRNQFKSCTYSFLKVLKWLKLNASDVIIASRWTVRFFPINGEIDIQEFNNQEGGIELDLKRKNYVTPDNNGDFVSNKEIKINAFNKFINSFDSLNIPIYLVYPIPEMGWDIPRMNYKIQFLTSQEDLKTISTSYDVFKKRNYFVNTILDSVNSKNIFRIKPEDIFCNTYIKNRCVGQINKTTFYSDDDHLSDAGAKLIVYKILSLPSLKLVSEK